MEVFRITRAAHASGLVSSGSSNRWNLKGQHVVYTGSSRSLATLELVVHGGIKPTLDYKVMVISIADDDHLITQVKINDLTTHWRSITAYADLQKIGSDWYTSQKSLILKIPSAIIPLEFNYIINTEHPEFSSKVSLVRTEDYFWDSRLSPL